MEIFLVLEFYKIRSNSLTHSKNFRCYLSQKVIGSFAPDGPSKNLIWTLNLKFWRKLCPISLDFWICHAKFALRIRNFISFGPLIWLLMDHIILHGPYYIVHIWGTISGTSYIFEAIEGQYQSSHRGHSISNHLTKLNLAKIIVESFSKMICSTSVI